MKDKKVSIILGVFVLLVIIFGLGIFIGIKYTKNQKEVKECIKEKDKEKDYNLKEYTEDVYIVMYLEDDKDHEYYNYNESIAIDDYYVEELKDKQIIKGFYHSSTDTGPSPTIFLTKDKKVYEYSASCNLAKYEKEARVDNADCVKELKYNFKIDDLISYDYYEDANKMYGQILSYISGNKYYNYYGEESDKLRKFSLTVEDKKLIGYNDGTIEYDGKPIENNVLFKYLIVTYYKNGYEYYIISRDNILYKVQDNEYHPLEKKHEIKNIGGNCPSFSSKCTVRITTEDDTVINFE